MTVVGIVEDNAANRLLLGAILAERYELRQFETGPDALGAFREAPPHVVLLDISLPGMDGLEVLAWMRADDRLRAVPVVALTAHAMDGDRERLLSSGFDEYIPKPIVDFDHLRSTVERLARQGRGRPSAA